jgi:serine protease
MALAAAVLVTTGRTTRAQTPSWVSPYPLILTPDRARAIVEASEERLAYVPGEVVVGFKPGMAPTDQQRALSALRSRPSVTRLRWSGRVAVLRDESEPDARVLASTLARQPEVAFAEPNYVYRRASEPTDPGYAPRQWNMKTLDMPRAWDINPGGSATITVAIVDSGITTVNDNFVFPTWNGTAIQNFTARFATNPDLAASRLVSPMDFVFWDGPVIDTVGHGTHVSGTIGQDSNNAVGEAGIAYHARIMPVKACFGFWEVQWVLSSVGQTGYAPLDIGGCLNDAIAAGITYAADNGAKVINLSLGGPAASQAVADALKYAVSKGAFVAIAAGNSYEQGNLPQYPAAYAADIDGVMSVTAVGPSLARAYYANTTSGVEIAAPGGNDREGNSTSAKIWQVTLLDSDSNAASVIFPRFDRYTDVALEGTSMATPHVAGLAALLMSQGVTKPAAIEALIKATARDLGAPGRDDDTGFGLIQPRTALRGFGVTR